MRYSREWNTLIWPSTMTTGGSHENCKGLSVPVKGKGFLYQLTDYQISQKDCGPWRWLGRTLESGFGKYLFSKLEHVWTRIHRDAVATQTLKCWRVLFEHLLFYVETLYRYLDRYVLRNARADMPMDLTHFPQCGYFDVWERSNQAAWRWTHFCKHVFYIAHTLYY